MSFSGCGHVDSLFTNEEQKKVGSEVFDTPATRTHLVYDTTNTDCHSCQPLLGVNLSPEFVNLYFPYADQCLLFFASGSGILNSNRHAWQWKEAMLRTSNLTSD